MRRSPRGEHTIIVDSARLILLPLLVLIQKADAWTTGYGNASRQGVKTCAIL